MTEHPWVCGIDAGSLNRQSHVAWLKGHIFLLDLYCPSVDQPLPKPPGTIPAVRYYAMDAPQGLPRRGRKRRKCDQEARTPTKVLPADRQELERSKLYKGLIKCGVDTFWAILKSGEADVFGLGGSKGKPAIAETYPPRVAESLGLTRLPGKRKDPTSYVEAVWTLLMSKGYRCESVIRPGVDHADAMLCAIAAQALLGEQSTWKRLGESPFVDETDSVLREGFIVCPADVPPGGLVEKIDMQQVATFEEMLRACLYEQEALRRVLVRKGLLSDTEVLEEIKSVRRELEGKRGR